MRFRISMCASAFAAAFVTTATLPGVATAQQRFITIGTGGVTGVYYPAGGASCSRMPGRSSIEPSSSDSRRTMA